jgi:DNA-binding transcriptional MerR regulator
MMVNEVARLTGVPPHVVRYYSRIGLLHPQRNPANGYKMFAPADVARLRFIRLGRRLGYSLTDIAAILMTLSQGKAACANMQTLLHQRLAQTLGQMKLLTQQITCMEHALQRWRDAPEDSIDLWELCGFLETLLDEVPEGNPEPTAEDLPSHQNDH